MSLTKREEQEVIWKLKRADEEQAYRFKDTLGSYRIAEKVFERFEQQTSLSCPDCGEKDAVNKYGTDKNDKQRYRCKDCGRTFVENHSMPFFHSHCSVERWKAFLTSMLGGATLRSLAETYDVCIQTAHRWRHRLLRIVRQIVRENWLAGRVWADEAFVDMNEPGRGQAGIDGKKIAILTAQDYKGRTFAVPTSPGMGSRASEVSSTFESYIVPDSTTLVTDDAGNFERFCEEEGVEHEVYGSKSDDMNMINWLHSHFKNWYRQFRGVGADYLKNYCAWFAFLKNNPELKPLAET